MAKAKGKTRQKSKTKPIVMAALFGMAALFMVWQLWPILAGKPLVEPGKGKPGAAKAASGGKGTAVAAKAAPGVKSARTGKAEPIAAKETKAAAGKAQSAPARATKTAATPKGKASPERAGTALPAERPAPAASPTEFVRVLERERFQYDAAGLRNPMARVGLSPGQLAMITGVRVKGIVFDERHPLAVVNDMVLSPGDAVIPGVRVTAIKRASVLLTAGDEVLELPLAEASP